jgi:hypothetical protein
MIELLNIGPVPWGEDCAQVGSEDYDPRSRRECVAFINQIRRVAGAEPPGAVLIIKSFPHDFGSYREVCCRYADENETAAEYAFAVEGHRQLENWDEPARRELGLVAAAA